MFRDCCVELFAKFVEFLNARVDFVVVFVRRSVAETLPFLFEVVDLPRQSRGGRSR